MNYKRRRKEIKNILSNILIVTLIAANIFVGMLNFNMHKPKCMLEGCNHTRVTGSKYCEGHGELQMERKEVCLKVISKNSN